MDVFRFRDSLIDDYRSFVEGFINIREKRIRSYVEKEISQGLYWPDPLIQLNPAFKSGKSVEDLVEEGILHRECGNIFRRKSHSDDSGELLRLYQHQEDAIRAALKGHNYVLTTGTGSGKSLSYIIPVVDHVLKKGSGRGVQAIIVYPMNALANSQFGELEKFLKYGYPEGKSPVTFERYTGQENDDKRREIIDNPPDIILTNFMMLELMLTRVKERTLIQRAEGLKFLVLDELHTYRGRQGSDVALLVRRVRERLGGEDLLCVGTSATMAGEGDYHQQKRDVARVSGTLFGSPVLPENVIGETLIRKTPSRSNEDQGFCEELKARLLSGDPPPTQYSRFVGDPLASWIESTFGVAEDGEGARLIRARPKTLRGDHGAAKDLSALTDVPTETCAKVIADYLLGGYQCETDPDMGKPPFAFRLHQFISRGDTVYCSLEGHKDRYMTLSGQQFVPGQRDKILLPMVFCRECGQEYYIVRRIKDKETGLFRYIPRELGDLEGKEDETGFLYFGEERPWSDDEEALRERLPEDWFETVRDQERIKKSMRDNVPVKVSVRPDGVEGQGGIEGAFIPTPFRFCPLCDVYYGQARGSDFTRLSTLSSEGRSTATTILGLSAIRQLKNDKELKEAARKLLSFTDNRQDASLQAGHFNDFVLVGLLRSALYRAVEKAGKEGLQHDELPDRVFDALNLPMEIYAKNPGTMFHAQKQTHKALKEVLGYRLYHDLRRGWRINLPNLEQCGLLDIKYLSLDEVCGEESLWKGSHEILVKATSETRKKVVKTLLDYMRRELAIRVDCLDQEHQDKIRRLSSQHLIDPWSIEENEKMTYSALLFPRSKGKDDYFGNVFLSPKGGYGNYLRRSSTFRLDGQKLHLEDTDLIIKDILSRLTLAGLVEEVVPPRSEGDVPGYQLPASCLLWVAGDGKKPFHDPLRVPNESIGGGRTNPFFVDFYKDIAQGLLGYEGREHTAQVGNDLRIDRENRFREGKLPILFCSPTMELGVDIAELNVVNMRNVPPTPANYAQRSGRAGRGGQPALVFSYCTKGSPHDQFFFKRPTEMVSGSVSPPNMDLLNEDLIRAHVYALWLSESGKDLFRSLKDILDLSGEDPSLELVDSIKEALGDKSIRARTETRVKKVLSSLEDDLKQSDWYNDGWISGVLNRVDANMEEACGRWRKLYRAALAQAKRQNKIRLDATRTREEKDRANGLRAEAESQINLLTDVDNVHQSDFYSYRYFASEGFLPGYNFPRLPISAYIPGRRKGQRDEFLSRPRFLAVSEFGPQSIIYHEGSRYSIGRAILPVDGDVGTGKAKICEACGYVHPIEEGSGLDHCEICGAALGNPFDNLLRMQNVVARRREKINADEEERLRQGYELKSGIRFVEHGGRASYRTATIVSDEGELGTLTYGHGATLYRINLGWVRRSDKDQKGFVLDLEKGTWEKNNAMKDENEGDDPMSSKVARVIPYVEDQRNCLLFRPTETMDQDRMASLQSALKNAIQVRYQLEDSELAAEPLPNSGDRKQILFYESGEGGAGVLRKLVDDPKALKAVAKEALSLCHFNPITGEDLKKAPHGTENCEAACYDCLMSYYNQRDHLLLDRKKIQEYLMALASAEIRTSSVEATRDAHLGSLLKGCESDLERKWLNLMEEHNLRLPSHGQHFIPSCGTRSDFYYDDRHVVIYIDGPHHDFKDRRARDQEQEERLEDQGFTVLRFGHQDDWLKKIAENPHLFGWKG
ncbi:ATP-dependent helicase YprA, contains C-terminal metal-binding DUF1998 domain [Dethiosulfovibrio salsuginis]|uniref:ATP-dependent helicase YprA, contains C-terminal metal-binding DUF1998 domain n=1 Tax=Dethiosulfovibrio salsuginis TaxID=561720 RepID=A0A1X7K7Z7_9BACT|nr:ATP-dependent helicase YprA, contains C-terminal metal-binding DUF1998 domain [Dethiosulfovibrio salsuginis]